MLPQVFRRALVGILETTTKAIMFPAKFTTLPL